MIIGILGGHSNLLDKTICYRKFELTCLDWLFEGAGDFNACLSDLSDNYKVVIF